MHLLRSLIPLAWGAGIGLILTWLGVFYLFPQLEDTTVGFDAPHLALRLQLHK